MAKAIQNINRLACWPELERAGFRLESFRGPDGRVNCRGCILGGILIYKNEDGPPWRPWVLSISGDGVEICEEHTGRGLIIRLRELRPDLFERVTVVTAYLCSEGIQIEISGFTDGVMVNGDMVLITR